MKSIIMQKLTKTIAALMLAIAVVCAAGCKKHNDGNGSYNGHDYIDLGLPSGTLWATCNVGADTPEGYGDYFAWGETQVKYNYDWNTYHYGGMHHLTKYCSSPSYGYNGFTDNLILCSPRTMQPRPTGGENGAHPQKNNGKNCITTPRVNGRSKMGWKVECSPPPMVRVFSCPPLATAWTAISTALETAAFTGRSRSAPTARTAHGSSTFFQSTAT